MSQKLVLSTSSPLTISYYKRSNSHKISPILIETYFSKDSKNIRIRKPNKKI
jgi:hypothetical protein